MTRLFLNVFILMSVFSLYANQPTFSENPYIEELFHEKAKLREMERGHRGLMNRYFQNGCPRNHEYAVLQRIFHPKWVAECIGLSQELEDSRMQLNIQEAKQDGLLNAIKNRKLK